MSDLDLSHRTALPDALRVLLAEYPREAWEADPNFSALIRFWLDRHQMFRALIEQMDKDVQEALDGNMEPGFYAQKLARFGGGFVNELHGHHQIEDMHYFPVLEKQDTRISSGFGILDKDHHQIDALLHGFADAANQLLGNPGTGSAFRDKSGAVKTELDRMAPMLDRHLVDEEELVVPVLLKFKPAGLS